MEKELEMELRDVLINKLIEVRRKFLYLRRIRENEDTFRLETDTGIFLCEKLLEFIEMNVNEDCICTKVKTCPNRVKE